MVDWGQHFVTACYTLGDGPLVLNCHETIYRIISAIQAPNVCALARSLCGGDSTVQLISLNRNLVNRNFRKWAGCEALAPIQDNVSL